MHSSDLTEQNIESLADLFPTCVTESRDKDGNIKRAVDFDLLRQELSDILVEGPQERYRLDWPGKREALLAANAPIAKTLRPDRDESVDFDTTKNLFIEGDNLEALKLLQETYLGKVKMIYIDPPYNTGNDFVYDDDFAEDSSEYFRRSNQQDEEGNRLVANTESNGRFHSDWLSMMYPRLKIARNLLRDDGVIISSIDENELMNLRKCFNEVFGEKNLLFVVTVLCNPKGRSQDMYVANSHEYLVGYSKKKLQKGSVNIPKTEEDIKKDYKLKDSKGRYRELELRNTHREFGKHNRKNLYYPLYVSRDGSISLDKINGSTTVYPDWDDGFEGCWTWGKEKTEKQLNELVARKVKGKWKIYRKDYAYNDGNVSTKQVKSIWLDKKFHTEKGQAVFNELFNTKEKIFQSPKSVDVIKQLLLMSDTNNSLILDFFAGSATTAHAVMDLNAEDGGNRQHIMVQLPEKTEEKSEAFKAGYKNIADIAKERIRRAGKKIKEENKGKDGIENLDIGFRDLKVDSSNMKDVFYRPDEYDQDMFEQLADNVKEDRSPEDLLFQVLLDWGVDLSLPIKKEKIKADREFEVYFVDETALAACFVKEGEVSVALCKELAARKPLRVVFRDAGFDNDEVRINVEQIFKQLSPNTEVKVI